MNPLLVPVCASFFALSCASSIAEDSPSAFDGPGFASLISPDANDFASINQLQVQLADRSLTSVQLVERALARIEALNHAGPKLNAVIENNPDALTIATALDVERDRGAVRGPLHGIPVLLKDNLDTADRMQTSAGSLALVGSPATRDAGVVQRLRQAGAVVLGKANLSEWAGFRDGNAPPGWSGRGGQTRNPLGLDFPTGGSSSGSAAGVAAGFVPIAVGTETNGSIIFPAYINGVVGMRPTHGLLSLSGVVPLVPRQDTPGPMARTVTDTALLLSAMQGSETEGLIELAPEPVDYVAALDAASLQGKRLGYAQVRGDGSYALDDPHFLRLHDRLEAAGAELVPIALELPELFNEQFAVLIYDFKRELATYLQSRPGIEVRDLAQVIAFNQANAAAEQYGQGLLQVTQSSELSEDAYQVMATRLRAQSQETLDTALTEHSLDALIDFADGQLRGVGAQAGYPGLTVPAGLNTSGQPVGLYFSGSAWSDAELLRMAYAFEQTGQ